MSMNDAEETIYDVLWTCDDEKPTEAQALAEFDRVIQEFDPLNDDFQEEPQDIPAPPPRSDSLKYGSVDSGGITEFSSDDPFRNEDLFSDYSQRPIPKPRRAHAKAPSVSSVENVDSCNDIEPPAGPPPPQPRLGPSDFDGESIENLDFDCEDGLGLRPPVGAVPLSSSPNVKVIIKPTSKTQRVDKTLSGELFVTEYTKKKFCKRWCILDITDKVLLVYSDSKSNVSKRIIPLRVIDNVRSVALSDDKVFRYELIISPPAVAGVATVCRSIFIGHKDQVQLSEWATTIMKLIIDRDKENGSEENAKGKEDSLGHKLVTSLVSRKFEKSGFIKMRGVHGKRLFAIISHLLVYFDSHEDFAACLPVHRIDMKCANVKPFTRCPNSLELNTPSTRTYYLVFDHPEEMDSWYQALERAIKLGLCGEDESEALIEARKNASNNFCADCGSNDTLWASVNFGLVICSMCSGLHRELGARPTSKVRGLEYDSRWTPSAMKLLAMIGNENGNNFWEAHLPADNDLKPKPDWPIDQRREFIVQKYREKKFADLHPSRHDPETLKEMLRTTVQTEAILDTMRLFFSLDHEFCIDDTDLVQLSKNAGQVVQSEFLIQNSRWYRTAASTSQRRVRPMGIIKKGFVTVSLCVSEPSFARRWCALAGGTAHFHIDEKDSVAKESLDLANDVVTIAMTEESDGTEPTITLFTNQRAFSVRSSESDPNDLINWMHAFCRSASPDVCKDYLSEDAAAHLLLVGKVHVKRVKISSWSNHWACLTTTRHLFLLDETLESNHVDDFDLRMVSTPMSDQEESAGERSFCFQVGTLTSGTATISRDGRATANIYFRAINDYLTKVWRSKLSNASTRCGNSLEDQVLTSAGIPLILSECINYINIHSEETDGLYRVGGVKSREEKLYEIFKKCPQSVHLTRGDWTVPEVTGALKKFLRGLDDPPMTRAFYEKWLEAAKMPDHDLKLQWFQYHLKSLPSVNYLSLRTIFIHINQLLQTRSGGQRMDAHGMARIFAQVLLSVYKDDIAGANCEIAIIHDFITYYVWLFEIDEDEQRRQEEEKRAIDKIQKLQSQDIAMDDPKDICWKIPIVLDVCCSDEPPVCQVDVCSGTTAQDVLNMLKELGKLNVLKHLALFEIVMEREVERNIFPTESVYDVCMNWRSFAEEYRSKVKLCVKQNYIFDRFEHAYEPDVSRKANVQYSDVCRKDRLFTLRNFTDRVLQLQDKSLKIIRNRNVVEDWDVHKIDVYHGIEPRRRPPNDFGLTIHVRGEGGPNKENEGASFRHAICFSSRQELYRWLAAIHYAKFNWSFCNANRESRAERPNAPVRYVKPSASS